VRLLHEIAKIHATFDDPNLVSQAGLVPVVALAQRAGLASLGACTGLLRRDAEHFGMGPAVVLGQDLTEAAGPVRHGAVADLATGDRQLGNGHREAAGR
jgi:hypothetical protein